MFLPHRLGLEDSYPKNLVPKFFAKTAKTYDGVVVWATFGKDKVWKKEILKQIPRSTAILDLACGTGILTRKIAERFPAAGVVGVDITQSYLDVAKENSKGYKNISFILQDAERLDLGMKFDCITSSYIPKYCDPKVLIKVCDKHLKVGGRIILHDFVYPSSTLMIGLWKSYFVLLRIIGCFIPSWSTTFSDLPKLIRSSSWVDDYARIMRQNGFDVTIRFLTWSTAAIVVGQKKSAENP